MLTCKLAIISAAVVIESNVECGPKFIYGPTGTQRRRRAYETRLIYVLRFTYESTLNC